MQGIVGAMRPQGTSLIIEDVCVRPERIAECARDVQALLGKHGFLTGVAGHASAGNLHFLLTPALGEPADRDRYEAFMGELVDLIVDEYDGSLKAEHGTGRNMAPYVAREWGEQATELMWRVKRLADPGGVLNPGAVLSDDPGIHLRRPEVHAGDRGRVQRQRVHRVRLLRAGLPQPRPDHHAAPADRAAPRDGAPARGLPRPRRPRARLRVRRPRHLRGRRLVQARLPGGNRHRQARQGAARGEALAARPRRGRSRAAERWSAVERAGRAGLRDRRRGGSRGRRREGRCPHARRARMSPGGALPQWLESLPRSAPGRLPDTRRDGAAAVYLPACINRIFGPSRQDPGRRWLPDALVQVSARAGLPVWIPPDAAGNCCATPWSSKGYSRGHAHMAGRLAEACGAGARAASCRW